jgi:osmotically-inducible protein OsmY
MWHTPKRAACFLLLLIAVSLQGCETSPATGTQAPAAAAAPPPSIHVTTTVENAINSTLAPERREAVAVHNVDGFVLITGQVLSEADKSAVSNAVAFSAGLQLRRLSNELRVVDSIDLASAAADANLAMAAKALLASADPALAELTTTVVDNARLYLLGRLTRAQGDEVTRLVRRLEGIASVSPIFDYTD